MNGILSIAEQLADAIRALELLYPDVLIEQVVVYLQGSPRPVVLPLVLPRARGAGVAGAAPAAPPAWEPNAMQAAILEALGEGPMTADRLAERSGYARQTLYSKPRGIGELLDRGLVVKGEQGYQLPPQS